MSSSGDDTVVSSDHGGNYEIRSSSYQIFEEELMK